MSEYIITKVPLAADINYFPPKRFHRMPILYLEMLENKAHVKKELINKSYNPPSFINGEPNINSDDIRENIREDVRENIRENIREDVCDDIREDVREDVREEQPRVIEPEASGLEAQLNSLLGETIEHEDELPPTFEELKKKKKIKVSDEYRYAEEDEETQKERNAVYFKYEVLRRMHPNAHIPEFTMYSDPKLMGQKYELLTKKLSLESSVDNWKRYMIIFVMGCEVVLGKMKFDMEGFAQQQIMSMSTYDQLLVEMAEKSYVPTGQSKWPAEIRLLMMLTMNIVLFVVSRMIFKTTGTNLLGTINELSPQQPERKMKEPE